MAETEADVALPGLESVREEDRELPEFEAPFALTAPVGKTAAIQRPLWEE
jgi:hypothetical protein